MYQITDSMSKSESERFNMLNHVEEALTKILRLEASKVSFHLLGYDITAYDMKNSVIRVDIKVG